MDGRNELGWFDLDSCDEYWADNYASVQCDTDSPSVESELESLHGSGSRDDAKENNRFQEKRHGLSDCRISGAEGIGENWRQTRATKRRRPTSASGVTESRKKRSTCELGSRKLEVESCGGTESQFRGCDVSGPSPPLPFCLTPSEKESRKLRPKRAECTSSLAHHTARFSAFYLNRRRCHTTSKLRKPSVTPSSKAVIQSRKPRRRLLRGRFASKQVEDQNSSASSAALLEKDEWPSETEIQFYRLDTQTDATATTNRTIANESASDFSSPPPAAEISASCSSVEQLSVDIEQFILPEPSVSPWSSDATLQRWWLSGLRHQNAIELTPDSPVTANTAVQEATRIADGTASSTPDGGELMGSESLAAVLSRWTLST